MTSKGFFSLHFKEKFAKKVATFKENHPELTPDELEVEIDKLKNYFMPSMFLVLRKF